MSPPTTVPAFELMVRSPQFTFLIGPQKVPIVLPSKALASLSDALNALINGDMSEAHVKCAPLDDIDVDDFIRVCEFAYHRDYTVPQCVIEELPEDQHSSLREPPTDMVRDEDGPMPAPDSEPELPSEPEPEPEPDPVPEPEPTMHQRFERRNYFPDGIPRDEIEDRFIVKGNSSPSENFSPVFLAHARLYSFAEKYLIQPLKDLVLQKLHDTFMEFNLYESRISDVIDLAQYAYSNTNTPDQDPDTGRMDELRALVIEYIAYRVNIIGPSDKFVSFMGGGGEFVEDFWRLVQENLL